MTKTPLKPDRPISSIVFPKTGRPYLRVEHLPRTQQELELKVGKKFLGALAHFRGERYTDLSSGRGRGDLVCKRADGAAIRIQVVEIVDQDRRLVQAMRTSYADAVLSQHPEVLAPFRGCAVTLVDSGDPPYLPKVSTRKGQKCMEEIVDALTTIGSQINSLPVRKIRTRKVQIGSDGRDVHVICERFAPHEADEHFSFRWAGGDRGYPLGQRRPLLSGAVEQKIRKCYSKPQTPFWLLAYSTDTLLAADDTDVLSAREILAAGGHPFDASWYLYPYNHRNLGHLVRIWASDENACER